MSKKSHLRLFGTNSVWLYSAEFIPRLGALLIVPLWTGMVAPTQYAHWVLAMTTVELLLGLGNMGLTNYMVKVLYRYHDERADQYFGMALKVVMLLTASIALLIAVLSPWLSRVLIAPDAHPGLFSLLAISLIGMQLNTSTILYIQSRIEYGSSFVLGLFRWATSMGVLLYCLLHLHVGYYSWVWSSVISEMLAVPLSLYYLRHIQWSYFNIRMASFAFRFSLPTIATQLLTWGQNRVGRYVLSFSGLGGGVGLLGMAQNISQNYGATVRPVKIVASQILGHTLEKDADSPYFLEFFHSFSCVGLAFAYLASLFFRDIMKLLMAPSYWEARSALPALIFALYMEEMFSLYHSLMFRYFKVWFDFTRALIAFPVVCIATLLLVPRLGFLGAAAAQTVGMFVMWCYAQRYAMKITRRSFRFSEKIVLTLAAFALSELAYVLRFPIGWRILLALAGLVPFLLYYWHCRLQLFPILVSRVTQKLMPKGAAV